MAIVDEVPRKEESAADCRRMENLLDGVRDYAIVLLDNRGCVLSWNDGATLLFGYHAAEVIGHSFAKFFTPEELQAGKADEEIRHAAVCGQMTSEEWQVRRDGTQFWGCAVITALHDERDELKGFVKVIRDTTDRRQLELEVRRQAEELAEANRRKDEFLAMLSHELRNPLAPVLNSVHVLRQAPNDPSLVQYAGNMVERQVLHMARLIDDLLDVTRLTYGKVQLRPERVELGILAERAADSVRPLMEGRHHAFTLVHHHEPIWLEADPVRLDQVIVNLLNNAAEFTDPGGHIQMIVTREETEALIRIRDDGTGIAPDLLPHVFDLFAQADTSLDREGGGLGIGLTLVKRVVTMHGGTIQVSSEGPGRGSEFIVRLPAPPELAQPPANSAESAGAIEPLRMLVVDDNVDVAMSLSILLQMRGHAVEVAHDGSVALELASAGAFEVILLDIGLPSVDGYEVARRIRSWGDGSRPRLVGISGYGFDTDRRRAMDAGFDAYLVKPVGLQSLETLLHQWSRRKPRDP
jgi:PAS domain S-box-containing protein